MTIALGRAARRPGHIDGKRLQELQACRVSLLKPALGVVSSTAASDIVLFLSVALFCTNYITCFVMISKYVIIHVLLLTQSGLCPVLFVRAPCPSAFRGADSARFPSFSRRIAAPGPSAQAQAKPPRTRSLDFRPRATLRTDWSALFR